MPSLRERLRRPQTYLLALALVAGAALADSARAPEAQITGRVWVGCVRLYQHYGRPVTRLVIRCRYQPTCSEYSLQAVQRFGTRHGLWLTVRRLVSCNGRVPQGTQDPVPPAASVSQLRR